MTTRAELIADVDRWTARSDLSNDQDMGTFLRLAEAKINRRIRVRAQETSTDLVCNSRTTALPTDYLHFRSVSLDSSLDRTMEYLPPERIREAPIWNNQGGGLTDNTAAAFTIEGTNLILAPAPSVASPVTLNIVYFAKFPALVNSSDTNWLLTNAYDVYLWALLFEAFTFLQDVEMASAFSSRFEAAVSELERSEKRARVSGSALMRTGNPRRTV